MPLLISYVDNLSEFRKALEKVEELIENENVQVANVGIEGRKYKLVLYVPDGALKLVRSEFPGGVILG